MDKPKVIIPIRSRRYPGLVIVIDPEDEERVRRYRWSVKRDNNGFYAQTTMRGPADKAVGLCLHTLIMGEREGFEVDHKNGNGLDCRRSNMRWATRSQNLMNKKKQRGMTSQFKGVSRVASRPNKPWRAYIRINGQQTLLGCFLTEEEAARAYDDAARTHFGEFARLNFPNEGESKA